MKPTLLVMAAGMGSRYGGLKQMDPIGPSGETIIDYSIFDAIRAGFGKVVFVVRESFLADFKASWGPKLKGLIEVEYVCQELDKLPAGFSVPAERAKPWGTGHAVLMAKDAIHGPFTVINGDDFYGKAAFTTMADFLTLPSTTKGNQYSLVGYPIQNTLSDNGSVSRGVCAVDGEGFLVSVTEKTRISATQQGVVNVQEDGKEEILADDSLVSMNFWGFTPSFFQHTERLFTEFLLAHGKELKSEFYVPLVVDTLVQAGEAKVKVLHAHSRWFGVTYQEDKPLVREQLNQLIGLGEYPVKLF